MFDRRHVSRMGLTAALVPYFFTVARAQTVDMAKLLATNLLPEKSFGSADAPVTIVEYASVTCGFCIKFHVETWPTLKTKYVDTGKVRFIIREFPLDALAAAGFMLARCAGDDKWYATLDLLYRTKESWGHAEKPADALLQTLMPAGFTKEKFEACLRDDKLFQGVKATSEQAAKEFGVKSTPTFFINGRREVGALTLEQFDKILEPLLAGRG